MSISSCNDVVPCPAPHSLCMCVCVVFHLTDPRPLSACAHESSLRSLSDCHPSFVAPAHFTQLFMFKLYFIRFFYIFVFLFFPCLAPLCFFSTKADCRTSRARLFSGLEIWSSLFFPVSPLSLSRQTIFKTLSNFSNVSQLETGNPQKKSTFHWLMWSLIFPPFLPFLRFLFCTDLHLLFHHT